MEQKPDNSTAPKRNNSKIGVGIGAGIAIGAGIGAALGNVAIGVAIGLAIGVGIGAVWSRQDNKNDPSNKS